MVPTAAAGKSSSLATWVAAIERWEVPDGVGVSGRLAVVVDQKLLQLLGWAVNSATLFTILLLFVFC